MSCVCWKHGGWYAVISVDGRKVWRRIVDEHGNPFPGGKREKAEANRLARVVEARVLAAAPRRRDEDGGIFREVVSSPFVSSSDPRRVLLDLLAELIADEILAGEEMKTS